jgi:hypothetical protein
VSSTFFQNFSKNSDNFVETDRTSEKFFDANSNSKKAKMTVCLRWRVAYSFKAPSANAPTATAQRLPSTSLVSSFHLIPFQEHSSDHRDSSPKEEFARPKPSAKVTSRTSRGPGGCERMVELSSSKGQSLTTLTPERLRSAA